MKWLTRNGICYTVIPEEAYISLRQKHLFSALPFLFYTSKWSLGLAVMTRRLILIFIKNLIKSRDCIKNTELWPLPLQHKIKKSGISFVFANYFLYIFGYIYLIICSRNKHFMWRGPIDNCTVQYITVNSNISLIRNGRL